MLHDQLETRRSPTSNLAARPEPQSLPAPLADPRAPAHRPEAPRRLDASSRRVVAGDGRPVLVPVAGQLGPILHRSADLTFGELAVRAGTPEFRFAGIPGHHMILLPGNAAWLQFLGEDRFLCDANTAVLLNPEQIYIRRSLARGERRSVHRARWIVLGDRLVAGMLSETRRPLDRSRQVGLFPHAFVPFEASAYVTLARLATALREQPQAPGGEVDELLLAAVRRLLAHGLANAARAAATRQRSARLVESVRATIAGNLAHSSPAPELAAAHEISVPFLNRIFRRRTALSPHQYLIQLRLRRALELLLATHASVEKIARAVGFASHSHLTTTFRRHLGLAPSHLRRPLPMPQLIDELNRELAK